MRRMLIVAALCAPIAGCDRLSSPIKQIDCTNRYPDGTSHQFPSLIFNKNTGETYRFDSFTEKLIPDNRVYDYDEKGRLQVFQDQRQIVLEAGGKIKHRITMTEAYGDNGEAVKESIQTIVFEKDSLKVLSNSIDSREISGARLMCMWVTPKTYSIIAVNAEK